MNPQDKLRLRLKNSLLEARMPQRTFAKRIGVTPASISFFLSGHVKNPGYADRIEAELDQKGFVKWTIMPRGDAILQHPHAPVTRQIRAEKAFNAESDADKIKQIAISLQGYTQQILPVLIAHNEERSYEDAVRTSVNLAVMARDAVLKKAVELASPKAQTIELLPKDFIPG